jgi:Fic family protein
MSIELVVKNIDTLKAQIDALLPMNLEYEKRLQKKFRLEFNYNSNHIEGNTLTYGQTQLLLLYDKSSGDASVSDIEEMKAHDLALFQIEEMAKDDERPLTETFIKQLNQLILVKSYWKDAVTHDGSPTRKKIVIGDYKSTPNSVQLKNGEIHEYASPEETPSKMHDLMEWYNKNKTDMHPVVLAAEFHYRFVCIHPFDDGNGRCARLIMNYILLKNEFPPVIIKSTDKESYLTALQKADIGDKEAILIYIAQQMIWSLELKIKAAKGEDLQEMGDLEKEIELLKREKLTKTTIYKTPKVAYGLIKHIDNNLCAPLTKILRNFDDFFSETSQEVEVDYMKVEKKETKRHPLHIAAGMFADREIVIKPHEIFGYDLDERDVKEVTWRWKMMGLKSASKRINFTINCLLVMKESTYTIAIIDSNSSNGKLFEEEKEYKSYLMSDDIEKMIRIVSNYILKTIKEIQ